MQALNSTKSFAGIIALVVATFNLNTPAKSSAADCVSPARGIHNWWPADGCTTDIIGGSNGILKNGAGYADGIVGLAFNLNSCAGNYVEVPHNDAWGFGSGDFTIETWVNFRSWNPAGYYDQPDAIFLGEDEGGGDTSKWFFAIHANRLTFHINTPASGPIWLIDAPFMPEINEWYHLAVTRQSGVFTFYLNGLMIGTPQYSAAVIPNPNAPLTIGQAEGLGFIDGLIDETAIYTRALSQSQIQAIFNAGGDGKCKPHLKPHVHPSNRDRDGN